MYCSIQEAWPEHNFGRDKIDNMTNQNTSTSIFNKNNILQNNNVSSNSSKIDNIEHFTSNTTCKSFIEHLEKCPECSSKIKSTFSTSFSSLAEKFAVTPELKETIIVFLIGILVLLILNLLFK